jgi:hypothetical protein
LSRAMHSLNREQHAPRRVNGDSRKHMSAIGGPQARRAVNQAIKDRRRRPGILDQACRMVGGSCSDVFKRPDSFKNKR